MKESFLKMRSRQSVSIRRFNSQRLIRLAEVVTMLGISRSSIYNYVAEGSFPAPVKVGERSVRWKLADVLAWRAKVTE